MNFLVNLSNNNVPVSKLVNAGSWSSCLAYCEGTGFEINSITQLSSNASVVLNNPSSENCYIVFFQSNTSATSYNYFVFDTDFESLETWINSQTDKTVNSIQLNKKSYVTV
jgi:hypothetical protein